MRPIRHLKALAAATAVVALTATAVAAAADDIARGVGGAQLTLPTGWSKVNPASETRSDPRTLLVIGTDGAKPIESDCQVSSYRVPA